MVYLPLELPATPSPQSHYHRKQVTCLLVFPHICEATFKKHTRPGLLCAVKSLVFAHVNRMGHWIHLTSLRSEGKILACVHCDSLTHAKAEPEFYPLSAVPRVFCSPVAQSSPWERLVFTLRDILNNQRTEKSFRLSLLPEPHSHFLTVTFPKIME